MATGYSATTSDTRRGVSSPRPKGRDAKNTLCRNITIYGHCRFENSTCQYVHDATNLNASAQNDGLKKRFNVDSPSFTPLQPATNGVTSGTRSTTISPKAANAAVFTPKSQRSHASTPQALPKEPVIGDWSAPEFPPEFVPQSFNGPISDVQGATQNIGFDPFEVPGISSLGGSSHQPTLNPYATDHAASMAGAGTFYQNSNTFTQPLQYHLYAPMGPYRENLLAYQRTVHDFFITEQIREDLHRKSEAARQILPNSSLPSQVDHFHSLVPLDTNNQKNTTSFSYPSWVYKAVSAKDGNTYVLRRLEGYRLTNETAIRQVQPWKRIDNGGVVTIHDTFTTRAFGDSSLIFVTDYHPLSKTITEQHLSFTQPSRFHGTRQVSSHVPEQAIWGYVVQLASALKAIHSNGLAARVISPSKVLVTGKNRVRLNACAVLDVVQYDLGRAVAELQQDDLVQLGRLILCITTNTLSAPSTMQKSLDQLARSYTAPLKECVGWLLAPAPSTHSIQSPGGLPPATKDIDTFLQGITHQFATVFDCTLHAEDAVTSSLTKELENGRLVRLMTKLNFINERPEFANNEHWSETGERYYLKLFRDFVFHQVDAAGNPVVDLGHVISCLNKLDAGSEEKVSLVTRDEQNVLIVSYRELKRGFENAFQELVKAGRAAGNR